MPSFKIVSVDMFGTLVNVDSIAPDVWKAFLKNEYSSELAEKYWNRASELVFKYFDEQIIKKGRYVSLDTIFRECYEELFLEIKLKFNPGEASKVLAYHHSHSKPYGDALSFLGSAGGKYPVCLSSDTSDFMLGDLTKLYPFDHIFTSENLLSYKSNSGGRFFSAVTSHYGISPEDIIHIGDSNSDVIGAHDAGVTSCWLNRNNRKWTNAVKPDYEAASLVEVAKIMGIY
jgi:FMN hydrolase / 5-amino-6-(5-phospho-D-ribitylamino)uracil phosphatase